MRFSIILSVAILLAIGFSEQSTNLRYIHSATSQGNANVTAHTPSSQVFTNIVPGASTSYTTLDAQSWTVDSAFSGGSSASGSSYTMNTGKYYSSYTYKHNANTYKNKVLGDATGLTLGSNAGVRAVNLASYNKEIKVVYSTSSSGPWTELFDDLDYGTASSYSTFSAGTYYFDYEIDDKRRGVEQFNWSSINLGSTKYYTYWVLPTGGLITADGSAAKKRGISDVRAKRAIQKANAKLEQLSEAEDN